MTIANLYRKLKQILKDSNESLVDKGLNEVDNLNEVFSEIEKAGGINRLPYLLGGTLLELTAEDIGNIALIGQYSFHSQTNLASVTIPDSVTTIGEYAFCDCDNLNSITIGNSVTTIGGFAFYNCANLQSVTIGNSVTTIGGSAFSGCGSLRNIFCESVTPPALKDRYSLPPSIKTIHVPIGSGEAYKNATNWSYHSDKIVEDIEI